MTTKSQITNLSHKSNEAQTLRILRINAHNADNEPTVQPRSQNLVSIRERLKGEATSPKVPLWERNPDTYYTGVGEFQIYGGRPGANDHAKYKSFGFPT